MPFNFKKRITESGARDPPSHLHLHPPQVPPQIIENAYSLLYFFFMEDSRLGGKRI